MHSEESNQTESFLEHTCDFVGFVVLWLKYKTRVLSYKQDDFHSGFGKVGNEV